MPKACVIEVAAFLWVSHKCSTQTGTHSMNLESQQKGGGCSGIHLTHSPSNSPSFVCYLLTIQVCSCCTVVRQARRCSCLLRRFCMAFCWLDTRSTSIIPSRGGFMSECWSHAIVRVLRLWVQQHLLQEEQRFLRECDALVSFLAPWLITF